MRALTVGGRKTSCGFIDYRKRPLFSFFANDDIQEELSAEPKTWIPGIKTIIQQLA